MGLQLCNVTVKEIRFCLILNVVADCDYNWLLNSVLPQDGHYLWRKSKRCNGNSQTILEFQSQQLLLSLESKKLPPHVIVPVQLYAGPMPKHHGLLDDNVTLHFSNVFMTKNGMFLLSAKNHSKESTCSISRGWLHQLVLTKTTPPIITKTAQTNRAHI